MFIRTVLWLIGVKSFGAVTSLHNKCLTDEYIWPRGCHVIYMPVKVSIIGKADKAPSIKEVISNPHFLLDKGYTLMVLQKVLPVLLHVAVSSETIERPH